MGQPVRARTAPQHRRQAGSSGAAGLAGAAGVAGNEKLTAMTGAVLLLGFAVEGCTILAIHRLLFLHFVVGLLLIGPVVLKIGSTIYRFVGYYTHSTPYVRKGPPSPVLRVLGPLVVMTSVAVLGTGVMLAVAGRGNGPWLFLHKASFVLWFGVMTIHVLNYAPRLPGMLTAGYRREGGTLAAVPGSAARWLVLIASLAVGVAVAALTMHLSTKWGFGGF